MFLTLWRGNKIKHKQLCILVWLALLGPGLAGSWIFHFKPNSKLLPEKNGQLVVGPGPDYTVAD